MTNSTKLNLTSLKKAYGAYGRMKGAVDRVEQKAEAELYDYELETVRAGLIQHFEFSYELCWKFMERYLHYAGIDVPVYRKDLFRKCISAGIISNFDTWVEFQDGRNETSHTYDEGSAEEVFQIAKKFYQEFGLLLDNLEARL